MKKIISILLMLLVCINFIACGNNEVSSNKNSNTSKNTKSDNKVYKQGEEAFITDNSGKKMYSIKINGVKTSNDFEYRSDFPQSNQKQIIEVDYTYKNIAKTDSSQLLIHGSELKVADETGAVSESSDMFPKQKPQEIPVGTNCTVQAYYGLSHESSKVKISFLSKAYPSNGALTFEMQVK